VQDRQRRPPQPPERRVGRLWPAKSPQRAFERAVKVAGLDINFHRLIMTTRYAHLSPGHLRTEIEKNAAHIKRMVST
jgi:hypothetical protein